jgi:imidazolonepropionase-like amidohydrolase
VTWLWPPIVDSHVHLALEPIADKLAAHGVEVAVDLAAPERALGAPSPIHVLEAGPMITHGGGYPLDAWGADGYGIGCDDAACVRSTIDRLASKGARVIKLALDDDGLAQGLAPVAVEAAHAKHLKVAVHALSNAGALVGAHAGADILAHTPVEALAPETIEAWRGRAVITTLAAFGSDTAIENLRKLRAANVTVLYGTDLGNLHPDGPSRDEMDRMRRAGMDDAAITAAMTTTPLAYWGLDVSLGLGLAPGKEGTLLVLDGDPRKDARVLLSPREVWLRGKKM